MIRFAARLLWAAFFLLLAGLAACAVLLVKYPETGAARFVERYYGPFRDKVQATRDIWFPADAEEAQEKSEPPHAKGSDAGAGASGGDAQPGDPATPGGDAADAAEPPADPFDDANRYAGLRIGAKDLEGKVVMVYVWNVDDGQSVALLPRIERIWSGYRHKPFVVLGSHRGGRSAAAEKVVAAANLSFPVYEGARLAAEPRFSGYPFVYVVNHKGKVVYRGRSDLDATEAAVTAIGMAVR